MIHKHCGATAITAAVAALLTAWTAPVSGGVPDARYANARLQFTAGGHALGFDRGAIHLASQDHMLRVEMVGARGMEPVVESDGGPVDQGTAGQQLGRLRYPDAWDGVSVVHEGTDQSVLRSSYQIAAGAGKAAIERIRLRYNRPVRVDDRGNVAISYESGEMIASDPVAWQETESGRTAVRADYGILGETEVGFEVGAYDPNLPLIIDGELSWNTFLGCSDGDHAAGIAVDSSGNVYVTGGSQGSWGSPVRPYAAFGDAFVAKLDASGSLVWNTFIGGNGLDSGYGIAVDSSGCAYVTGSSTESWGSPMRLHTGSFDAFAAKLDANGWLVWNTFLGDLSMDSGAGIAVDGYGNAYVTGYSIGSWGSPVRPYTGYFDAFAAKLNATGTLLWNTFLGGSPGDIGNGIAVDGAGNAYVTGSSNGSWGSPVRAYTADEDAFAAKLDAAGALVWNTFLGASAVRNTHLGGSKANDSGEGIAVDGAGNAYVTGHSCGSWGAPVSPYNAGDDAFAAKLDPNGVLVWNSFLGGTGGDYGSGIAVDGAGNAYVTGQSGAAWGSPVRAFTGENDAFAAKLNAGGSVLWGTFLGGSQDDEGRGICVDTSRNAYVAGISHTSWGSPVRAHAGEADAFVAKLVQNPPAPTITQIKSKRATPGSKATIVGTGFSTTKNDNVVYFGKKKAEITRARATRLNVKIPSNCKKGKVNVYATVKGIKSNIVQFTVK
ncbi:MAG: SBBP repeat-containing protein [Acidobacteriota bacterium]